MSRLLRILGFALSLSVLCAACLHSAAHPTTALSSIPDDPTLPYVISAIDDHFHDAHPTLPIQPGRALIFRNQGLNPHNVTIVGTAYSRDFSPGESLEIPNISRFLGGPGEYAFYCKYHVDRGMVGIIVVADSP